MCSGLEEGWRGDIMLQRLKGRFKMALYIYQQQMGHAKDKTWSLWQMMPLQKNFYNKGLLLHLVSLDQALKTWIQKNFLMNSIQGMLALKIKCTFTSSVFSPDF